MADRPRLLDLFCGAGGASMGYAEAGFEVLGVDIEPQPNYPFPFYRHDAMTFPLDGFDVIHASPPCQRYSTMTRKWGRSDDHPDLVEPTRQRLLGRLYVIENVVGAPLLNPIRLCGSSFGLAVRRHRLFELPDPPLWVPACDHEGQGPALQVNGHAGGSSKRDPKARFGTTDEWRAGMGIPWMTGNELAEAIPPAYTRWIGEHLLDILRPAEENARMEVQP